MNRRLKATLVLCSLTAACYADNSAQDVATTEIETEEGLQLVEFAEGPDGQVELDDDLRDAMARTRRLAKEGPYPEPLQAAEAQPKAAVATYGYRMGFASIHYNDRRRDHTPRAEGSHNAAGGSIWVDHQGTGRYRVYFRDMSFSSFGNAHAASTTANVRCKVAGWGRSSNDVYVNVRCHYELSNSLSNAAFNVYYDESLRDVRSTPAAFAWVARNGNVSSHYSYNSEGGANVAGKIATGRYLVILSDLDSIFGSPMVTAYGSDASYCRVGQWLRSSPDTFVVVRCFDGYGEPSDSAFSLMYQERPRTTWYKETGYARVSAGGSTNAAYSYSWNSSVNSLGATAHVNQGEYRLGFRSFPSSPRTFLSTGMSDDERPFYCQPAGPRSDTVRFVGSGLGAPATNTYCFDGKGGRAGFLASNLGLVVHGRR